jgi:hypothetical protein
MAAFILLVMSNSFSTTIPTIHGRGCAISTASRSAG